MIHDDGNLSTWRIANAKKYQHICMFDHFGGLLFLMSSFDQWLEDVISFWESLFSRANCQFQGGYQILICCFFRSQKSSGDFTGRAEVQQLRHQLFGSPKLSRFPKPPPRMTGGYGPNGVKTTCG